jgi:O-antigen biosynthesis protein WbqP
MTQAAPRLHSAYVRVIKPIFDGLFALVFTLLLSPVLLVLSLLVKLGSPGPVFFCQRRVGKDKTTFIIYKFRTMRIDTPKDVPTHLLSNPHLYLTPIGRFLRKSSLDELPQIFNVLRGQMSFLGPRPALWNQFDLIDERDRYHANDIKPGISGWAQVNGRDEMEIPVKARFDGEYVQHVSLCMDLRILCMTAINVVSSKGVREGKKAK